MSSSASAWKRLAKLPEMSHGSIGPSVHPGVMVTLFPSSLCQVFEERIGTSCRLLGGVEEGCVQAWLA